MRFLVVAFALAALSAAPPDAQPAGPVENLTVTSTRSHQLIENFVQGRATPARLTGKIARWEDGVCPITVGLRPEFAKFITAQVKELAASVGAPVNSRANCPPNIEIVFTLSPQLLLDNVRKKQDAFLGYAQTSVERDRLAKVIHPIQAWYTTATKDLHGNSQVDSARAIPAEIVIPDTSAGGVLFNTIRISQGAKSVTGTRLGDGLRSTFYNVIVVADPSKLLEHEMGTVADYVGLLALTQLNASGDCQPLPSIADLLAPDCPAVNALTENDMAYLRGLYAMSSGRTLRSQEDEMTYRMEQAFQGH